MQPLGIGGIAATAREEVRIPARTIICNSCFIDAPFWLMKLEILVLISYRFSASMVAAPVNLPQAQLLAV